MPLIIAWDTWICILDTQLYKFTCRKYWCMLTKIYTVKDNQVTLVSRSWGKKKYLIWVVKLLTISMQIQWIFKKGKYNKFSPIQKALLICEPGPGNTTMNLRSSVLENDWVYSKTYNFSRKPVETCRYWVMRETQENNMPLVIDMKENCSNKSPF